MNIQTAYEHLVEEFSTGKPEEVSTEKFYIKVGRGYVKATPSINRREERETVIDDALLLEPEKPKDIIIDGETGDFLREKIDTVLNDMVEKTPSSSSLVFNNCVLDDSGLSVTGTIKYTFRNKDINALVSWFSEHTNIESVDDFVYGELNSLTEMKEDEIKEGNNGSYKFMDATIGTYTEQPFKPDGEYGYNDWDEWLDERTDNEWERGIVSSRNKYITHFHPILNHLTKDDEPVRFYDEVEAEVEELFTFGNNVEYSVSSIRFDNILCHTEVTLWSYEGE